MTDNTQLLAAFAQHGDEQAFRELVERHINLVYSTALRRVNGNAHLAQDITQSVFTDFARKAKRLGREVILSGWLYQHTIFTASNILRAEQRRLIREQHALAMNTLHQNPEADWEHLAPVLEEAMQSLPDRDRDAVVLRLFELQPLREVGAALGISEDAARMRVDRAVEKLRDFMARREVKVSGAGLAVLVSARAISAAPAGMAAGVAAVALSGATSLLSVPAILKFTLAGGGALMITVAVLLHFKGNSDSGPGNSFAAVNGKQITVDSSLPPEKKALWVKLKTDPSVYQKLLERHDRSVAAHKAPDSPWEEMMKKFQDSLKDELGLKKYGAKAQMDLGPDDVLVTGGWQIKPGKRTLIFTTAQWSTNASGEINPLLTAKIFEVADAAFDSFGLQSYRAETKESTLAEKFSAQKADELFKGMRNKFGMEVVSMPRINTPIGIPAELSTKGLHGSETKETGQTLQTFSTMAEDGKSVNFGLTTLIITADGTDEGQ